MTTFHKRILLACIGVLLLLIFIGCPLYRFFGITCPCCGVTRAWLAFLGGDPESAFRYHLFFLIIPPVLLLFLYYEQIPAKWRASATLFSGLSAAALFIYNALRWFEIVEMP